PRLVTVSGRLIRRQLLGLGHVALSTTNRQERWRDQRFIHSLSPAGRACSCSRQRSLVTIEESPIRRRLCGNCSKWQNGPVRNLSASCAGVSTFRVAPAARVQELWSRHFRSVHANQPCPRCRWEFL